MVWLAGAVKSADGSLGILSFFSLSPRLSDLAESPPSPLSLERVPTLTTVVVSLLLLFPPSNQMGKSLEKEEGEKMGQHNGKKSYRRATMLFSCLDTFLFVRNFHARNVGFFFLVCTRSPVLCFHF